MCAYVSVYECAEWTCGFTLILISIPVCMCTTQPLSLLSTRALSSSSKKVVGSVDEALSAANLESGDTVLVGGFGLNGIPMGLIQGKIQHTHAHTCMHSVRDAHLRR